MDIAESDGDEDEGMLFHKKVRSEAEKAKDAKEDREIDEARTNREREEEANQVLAKYFGKVEEMTTNEAFLRDYIMNKVTSKHKQNINPKP